MTRTAVAKATVQTYTLTLTLFTYKKTAHAHKEASDTHEGMSLWEIKECEVSHFNEASIEEIAQAICHAQWDILKLPYAQRTTHTFHPDSIDLDEFNVGNSFYNKT